MGDRQLHGAGVQCLEPGLGFPVEDQADQVEPQADAGEDIHRRPIEIGICKRIHSDL